MQAIHVSVVPCMGQSLVVCRITPGSYPDLDREVYVDHIPLDMDDLSVAPETLLRQLGVTLDQMGLRRTERTRGV